MRFVDDVLLAKKWGIWEYMSGTDKLLREQFI